MSTLVAPLADAPPLRRYGIPFLTTPANPAAGAHFTPVLPSGLHFRLLTCFCRLVTDANAANRQVLIEYRDAGTNRYMLAGASTTQAASLTQDWAFSAWLGWSDFTIDATALAPLPQLILPPTHDFRLYVSNIQATDQLSRIRFVWELFDPPDNPPGRNGTP